MPLKSRLISSKQQHVSNFSDAVLAKATGVSWSEMARVLGYSHPSCFTRKLNRYRAGNQVLPLQLSCLVETALWRLGRMQTYITIKQYREGCEGVSWHMLPKDLR